jgi:DnaJ-class molecular chaperone
MAQDPYSTLGVPRTASQDDIKAAFRKLAKKHHPDLNPGNKAAEAKFKAASAANELLSDPERRASFDRGDIDAEGKPSERAFYQQYADTHEGARYQQAGADDAGFADIFADLFNRGGGGPRGGPGSAGPGGARPMRGQHVQARLTVPFLQAARGETTRITLPDSRNLEITIPPGTDDGQVLRLRGQGDAGWNGGPAGDLLIEVNVEPHPFFRREGDDIHIDLPVTVAEAVLGAKVTVPTLNGPVTLTVPRHSDHGKRLRLRGRGIPAHAGHMEGDLYVTLHLVIGKPDAALEQALGAWATRNPENPRAHLTVPT